MSRTHLNVRNARRTAVLVTSLALALVLGFGAALPAAAARPGDDPRPSWAAPLDHLAEVLGKLFGGAVIHGDDGPGMDPDGRKAEGDHGPGMDPDGREAEGDDGPDMDPDG